MKRIIISAAIGLLLTSCMSKEHNPYNHNKKERENIKTVSELAKTKEEKTREVVIYSSGFVYIYDEYLKKNENK